MVRVALSIGAPLVLKSIPEGAATQTYVAVHPSVAGVSGKYFADCNESQTSRRGRDEELAAKLEPLHGILVPGGFGERGSEGKIASVRFARERKVPFFGICLGMQMACVEGARSAGIEAGSTVVDQETQCEGRDNR